MYCSGTFSRLWDFLFLILVPLFSQLIVQKAIVLWLLLEFYMWVRMLYTYKLSVHNFQNTFEQTAVSNKMKLNRTVIRPDFALLKYFWKLWFFKTNTNIINNILSIFIWWKERISISYQTWPKPIGILFCLLFSNLSNSKFYFSQKNSYLHCIELPVLLIGQLEWR